MLPVVPGTVRSRSPERSVLDPDFHNSWSSYDPASEAKLKSYIDAIVSMFVRRFYISRFAYIGNFKLGPVSLKNIVDMATSARG